MMEEDEDMVIEFIPCLILSCLQYADIHYYFRKEFNDLLESFIFRSISGSVIHFYIAFEEEFRGIIESAFVDPLFMKSKSRFLIEIGSRCLKMSANPTFFSFLLMCSFVGHVATFCYTNGICYRVVENACKCAIAIFKRKFLEYFNQEDGLFGLLEYCIGLNEIVLDRQDHYENLKDFLCPGLESQTVISLLNSCKYVDSDQYFLTDFERKLLYKAPEKKLNKLKPNLDFLIRRIPQNYFQMPKNQEDQNAINNVDRNEGENAMNYESVNVMDNEGQIVINNEIRNALNNVSSNLEDKKSNKRAENSYQSVNLLPSKSSVLYRTCSYSSPIDYTIKSNPESSNCGSTEREPEVSNCHNIGKVFEPSNYCMAEKPLCLSNYFIEKNSESSYCSITDKRCKLSDRGIIKKQPEPSNNCFNENEIEALNLCIVKKDSKSSRKETLLEESLSLSCYQMNRKNLKEVNYETSNKQPNSTTPRKLKRKSIVESMNAGLLKKYRIKSPDYSQTGTSAETDVASPSKMAKISNSLQSKLSFESGFISLLEQSIPHSFQIQNEFSKKYSEFGTPSKNGCSIHNYASTSSFNMNPLPFGNQTKVLSPISSQDSLQNIPTNNFHPLQEQNLAKVRQDELSLRTHSETASTSRCSYHYRGPYMNLLPSYLNKDNRIYNYPTISSSNMNLPFEAGTEAIYPLSRIDYLQEQDLARVHLDGPFLRTNSEIVSTNRCSDHHDRRPHMNSSSSLSSSSSSSSECLYSSSTQYSSEGFHSSESDISGDSENEEYHSYTFLRLAPDTTCWDSAPSESEYSYEDLRKDVNLKSLCNRKCFHCGTKCFKYIMYVIQQFTSHFKD